jgi:hypothetical protein
VASTNVTRVESDSATLERIGLGSGRQLVAYVMVSSKCAACNSSEVKDAIRGLRQALGDHHRETYRRVSIVGVAVDGPRDGLSYLEKVGLDAFDEIDIGRGWLNEQVVRHIWRDNASQAEVPQIILVERRMAATLTPLSLQFGSDSLLRVVLGKRDLIHWLAHGTPTNYATRVVAGSE